MPTHVITTLSVWGAEMGQQSIQGIWSDSEKLNHINYSELKTVLIVLQHWENQLRNHTVSLQLDTTTAVAYLIKEGGHTVRIPALSGRRDSDVSRSAEHIGTTKLPAWSNEHGGRCLVMVEEGQGMDAGPRSSMKHIHDIRSAGGRPFCIRERQTADTLLLHGQTRPPLPGDGRSTPQLGASRTNRFSESLLFRRFIALKAHCSKKKVYCAEGLLVRRYQKATPI